MTQATTAGNAQTTPMQEDNGQTSAAEARTVRGHLLMRCVTNHETDDIPAFISVPVDTAFIHTLLKTMESVGSLGVRSITLDGNFTARENSRDFSSLEQGNFLFVQRGQTLPEQDHHLGLENDVVEVFKDSVEFNAEIEDSPVLIMGSNITKGDLLELIGQENEKGEA